MLRKRINPEFGRRLAEAREAKGLSQPALAEASGVPVGTVREFEQGRREPLFGSMLKLGAALGLDLNTLPSPLLEGSAEGARKAAGSKTRRPRKGPAVAQEGLGEAGRAERPTESAESKGKARKGRKGGA